MTTNLKKTKEKRRARLKRAGRDRKRMQAKQSTPKFPIHIPEHQDQQQQD